MEEKFVWFIANILEDNNVIALRSFPGGTLFSEFYENIIIGENGDLYSNKYYTLDDFVIVSKLYTYSLTKNSPEALYN